MKKAITLLFSLYFGLSFADSLVLNDFLNKAKTIKADFSQTIISGKKTRTTNGVMEISRPNKFRWEYTQDQQLIVSDAKQIYLYDKPLQQVTIKQLGQSIDKSPAAVLAGATNINNLYNVTDSSSAQDGLKWVQIVPRSKNDNNGFQIVMMGFDKQNQLNKMQFTDSFGNRTSLVFSNVETGVSIPQSDYQFKVPNGVDVLQQ